MELEEWERRASDEAAYTLHKFNFDRERSYGHPDLVESHETFSAFLKPLPASDPRSADDLVQAFSQSQPKLSPPDRRFLPPTVHREGRQIFLRKTGTHFSVLEHFGFDMTRYRSVVRYIEDKLRTGPVNADLETELQLKVESLKPVPEDHVTATLTPTGTPPDRLRRSAPAISWPRNPWWFTFEDAADSEERRLGGSGTPLQRSGYVAGLRAGLGLSDADDSLSDKDMAAGSAKVSADMVDEMISKVVFRIFYQLAVDLPAPERDQLRQPGMFSGGFPHLFVTTERSVDGGRTVRLKDRSCTDHAHCQCARDGLPEGVVPQDVVMDDTTDAEVKALFLALSRDLARYTAPSCDLIRACRGRV